MRWHLIPPALVLGLCLLTLPACSRQPDGPVAKVTPPPTEEEAKQFATALSDAVKARDAAQIDRLVHFGELIERVVDDLGPSPNERDAWLAGARRELEKASFGKKLVQSTADGGSYTALRVRTVAGRPRVLFRQLGADGSFQHHDFVLRRFPDGVGAEDIHVVVLGEMLSTATRRLLAPLLGQRGRGARIKGPNGDFADNFRAVGEMMKATRDGDFATALTRYRGLPRTLQEDKMILLSHIQLRARQGEVAQKEYLAAMETYRRLYPDDAAVDFVSLDAYVLKEQYDEALAAVGRIDRAVGGDP